MRVRAKLLREKGFGLGTGGDGGNELGNLHPAPLWSKSRMQRNFLVWVLVATPIGACSCGPQLAACEAAWRYSAVFLGTILERNHNQDDTLLAFQTAYLVRVDERFRGLRNGESEIFVDPDNTTCGERFEVGKRYLLFVTGDGTRSLESVLKPQAVPRHWASHSSRPVYFTSQCDGNRAIEEATEDLDWLRGVMKGEALARIFGRAVQNRVDRYAIPVAGASISVDGENLSRHLLTDSNGNFAIDLPPGEYSVRAERPPWTPSPPNQVSVQRGECAKRMLILGSRGVISGIVLDAKGLPVKGVSVSLTPGLDRHGPRTALAETSADGRFRFEHVPSATYTMEYFMFLSARSFLLGAPRVLQLGVHEAIEGIEIRIPELSAK